jgi:hypothetical protein
MKNSLSFLSSLTRRSIRLSVSGDNLKIDAPIGVLTEIDYIQLRERKATLIALLSQPYPAFLNLYEQADVETQYWLDERAAVAEFDGKLSRPEAEAQAVWEYLAQNPFSAENLEAIAA